MLKVSRRRRRRRKRFTFRPKPFQIALGIVLLLLGSSLYVLFTNQFGLTTAVRGLFTARQVESVDADSIRYIAGDYNIDAAGGSLENAHVGGNLYLGPGIGNGSVDLVNVTVDGSVLIQGGGLKTINMFDCRFTEAKVNRPDGKVRLVAYGTTDVRKISLETGARLVENLAGDSGGFNTIEVVTTDSIELSGNFEEIAVMVKDANLKISGDYLGRLYVARGSSGARILYPENLYIGTMQVDAQAFMLGSGFVDQMVLTATGIYEMSGNYGHATITAEAGHFNLLEDTVFRDLVVAEGAYNNALFIDENVLIDYLELNEAVEVKGKGDILRVLVNAPGSTLDQVPRDIAFGLEVTVMIDGHEIKSAEMLHALIEHGDPGMVAAETVEFEESEPEEEVDQVPEGETEEGEEPEPETETEPEPKPEPEPEPEPKPDPKPDPDPVDEEDQEADNGSSGGLVRDFIVDDGSWFSIGKKLVVVILNVTNPLDYKVTVGDTVLDYSDVVGGFRGEVPEEDAVISKLNVTKIYQ